MPRSSLTKVFLLLAAVLVAGCQADSDEASLPPLRLSPPTIISPTPQVAAAPTPAPAPQPAPLHKSPPPAPVARATDPFGSIPAAWIPSVPANHWMWIIIHHSDSSYGSAAIIDKWHRDRGFDELGYHFVIGNGTNSGDGQIEVGPRWTKQKWGAHDNALDNRFNTNGIGICLVGNFNVTHPTPRQLHSLVRLVVYLMEKYSISADHVLGHGETKDTQCPGKFMNVAAIRLEASRLVQADRSGAVQVNADTDR